MEIQGTLYTDNISSMILESMMWV